ncbi:MAG: hypothetical protein ACREMB_24890, partial [Candidatus Rokuibacteriota bacterium]
MPTTARRRASMATMDGVEVRGRVEGRLAEILTPPACAFVARLQREFGSARADLLRQRAERQRELDAGA